MLETNTTYEEVVSSFESTFQDKYEIPDSLVYQFFIDSLAEYELEIQSLDYNNDTKVFNSHLPQYVIITLGLYMKVRYCKREISRMNKLANIVTKDLSQTGTGDQKIQTRNEMLDELNRLNDLINKQKVSWFD